MKVTRYKLLPAQKKFLFGFSRQLLDRVDEKGNKKIYQDIALYQGGMTCVPADTEYLSPTGWKRIDTLSKDDKLAIYHSDGTITFDYPKEVFKWPADVWYNFNTIYVLIVD